ncbi:hypothetical protein ACWGMA_38260 [Streptomyces asiaticus]
MFTADGVPGPSMPDDRKQAIATWWRREPSRLVARGITGQAWGSSGQARERPSRQPPEKPTGNCPGRRALNRRE